MSTEQVEQPEDTTVSDRTVAILCGLWALLLYGTSAPAFIVGGDSAEFVTTSVSPGFAHPSGYPLLSFLLAPFHLLPFASPAQAAGVGSAVMGAIAVACLYLASRSWGAKQTASLVSTLAFTSSPLMWEYSTKAEVFSLNTALIAAMLWLSGPHLRGKESARAVALGLLAGLGLANNHTCVLIAPVGLFALYRLCRSTPRRLPLAILAGATTLTLPYVTMYGIVINTTPIFTWGTLKSVTDLVPMFLREDYGTFSLTLGGDAGPVEQWSALTKAYLLELWGLPFLGIAGLVYKLRARQDRLAHVLLLTTVLLSGFGLVSLFQAAPEGTGALMIRKFYLASMALSVVPTALCIDPLHDWLVARANVLGKTSVKVVAAAVVAVTTAVLTLPKVQDSHSPMLQNYLLDTLEPLPKNAVVMGNGDHRAFGMLYVQRVLKTRPDTVFVDPKMLHNEWYREQTERIAKCALPAPKNNNLSSVELAVAFQRCGRPVFLTNILTDAIPQQLPTFPYGTTIAVLPAGAVPPPPQELVKINKDVFARYRRLDQREHPDAWAREVSHHYRRTWDTLEKASEATGNKADADFCRKELLRWRLVEAETASEASK